MPELRDLPKAERDRIWAQTIRRAFVHWQFWAVMLAGLILIYFTISFVGTMESDIAGLALAGLVGGLVGLGLNQVAVHVKRPYMRELVAEARRDESLDVRDKGLDA